MLPRVSETDSKQIVSLCYLSDRLIELPRELDAEDEVLAASRADRVMRDLKVLPSLQANASIQHGQHFNTIIMDRTAREAPTA